MIELRWVKDNGSDGMMHGVRAASGDWVVLQYRQEKPGLMVQGMPVLGETTDWQDVEISDD